jgi:DnaJ-class molecular chaperone
VVNEKKVMEIFIEKGMRNGEKIPMKGEGDQLPDVEPGDVILVLQQKPHGLFERNGADLSCKITLPLVEALCGFSKVLVTHLDGRGIHVEQPGGSVIKPGQVKKIAGEGMPHFKRPMDKGDLYITFEVEFPEDGWATMTKLRVSTTTTFFFSFVEPNLSRRTRSQNVLTPGFHLSQSTFDSHWRICFLVAEKRSWNPNWWTIANSQMLAWTTMVPIKSKETPMIRMTTTMRMVVDPVSSVLSLEQQTTLD